MFLNLGKLIPCQMVPAGMPELSEAEDILYMKDKLLLDMNDTDVSLIFFLPPCICFAE